MRGTLRVLTPIVALLTAGAALAGCASHSGASGTGAVGDTSNLSSVTLTVGDQVSGLKTLLTASGALRGAPYHVNFAEFQGAAPLFQAVQAGDVDTGYAADLPTLAAIAGGVPVKAVAALHASGAGTTILTQPGSTAHSVADLRGKTVVVSSAKGSIAEDLLANALAQAGLTYSDVHVEYLLPTAALPAFEAHKIDVWATFGVYQVIAQQAGARTLIDGEDGRTSGIGLISATSSVLSDPGKHAALADLLKRVNYALVWSRTHASQYAAAYASTYHISLAVAKVVLAEGSSALLPVSTGVQSTLQQVSNTMSSIGSLTKDVNVSQNSDASLYGPADETASTKTP